MQTLPAHPQMQSYDRIAKHYADDREGSTVGLQEVDGLLETLPQGASVLDVGCGTGKPISERIAQHPHQFRLFAVDASSEMVDLFRTYFPHIPVQRASVLAFDFFQTRFDAVVSWGVMFHLTESEQQQAIASIAAVLRDGGYFLFTSGKERGMRHGTMYEVEFSYCSLGTELYREVLKKHGLTLIDDYLGTGENYYYLAQKIPNTKNNTTLLGVSIGVGIAASTSSSTLWKQATTNDMPSHPLVIEPHYKNAPTLYAKSRADFRAWLEKHHTSETKLWLVIFKKDSGTPSVTYDQAVDEALCYGWVDSSVNKRDAGSFYQYFAQRNPKSNWSRVNKEKVARLTEQGLMSPAGQAMIDVAQKTGTWTALDDVENLVIPPDLSVALELNPQALEYFTAFPRSAKRGILEWLLNAKTAITRTKRITEIVAKAEQNKRANQPA